MRCSAWTAPPRSDDGVRSGSLTSSGACRTPGQCAAAAELFVERGRRLEPRTPWDPSDHRVVELCARLDGLPLAVELAAGQVRRWSLAELRRRLDDPTSQLFAATQPPPAAAPHDGRRHRFEHLRRLQSGQAGARHRFEIARDSLGCLQRMVERGRRCSSFKSLPPCPANLIRTVVRGHCQGRERLLVRRIHDRCVSLA